MARMPESYRHYEDNFVDLNQPEDSAESSKLWVAKHSVICTDDRGIEGIPFANQIPGGAERLEADVDMARALQGVANTGGNRIDDIRWIAEMTGATNHVGCAAIAHYLAIAEYQANPANAERLLSDSEALAPGAVTERDVEMMQSHLQQRIQEAKQAGMSVDDIIEAMGIDGDDDLAVPMLPLHHQGDHIGKVMIGNGVAGMYFDTQRAYRQGANKAAYGVTLHGVESLASTVEVSPSHLLAATVLRSVSVAAHLPNPDSPDGMGVTPVYYGRSLHEVV